MGAAEHDRLLDTLAEGVLTLTTSDSWRSQLELQCRFHRYSFNNALLIGVQDPEATRVAGFATWRMLGRSVRKGERAIWILAPVHGRRVPEDDGEERRPIVGFRRVAVFDVAQTDGDDLPVICSNPRGRRPVGLLRGAARAGAGDRLLGRAGRAPGHHQWGLCLSAPAHPGRGAEPSGPAGQDAGPRTGACTAP